MKKLWQTNYSQNKTVEAYCFGQDSVLDNKLVPYDIWGSMAHIKMLVRIGILTKEEFIELHTGMLELLQLFENGTFAVTPTDEDVHTAVESFLIEKIGTAGKKMHTGRSRNDQIYVDIKLFTKDVLHTLSDACINLSNEFVSFAKEYEFIPMPGYTHMQKAMPSSIGLWASSFAESLYDDLSLLKTAYILNDQSPLGAGASYDVSLPINRELTAKLLGFSKMQNNVLYKQASRGKVQLAVMHGLSQIMITLSKFAQDMLLFTMSECNYFSVAKEFCTGSSIMPQKKNLDLMEIVRAKSHIVLGNEYTVAQIIAGLPSGYNADFGQTKQLFITNIETVQQTLDVVLLFLKYIHPNEPILQKACTPEIFATEQAFALVKKGTSFRDAHQTVAKELDEIEKFDVIDILKKTNHTGGPGKLGLTNFFKQIKKEKKWWKKEKELFEKAISNLLIATFKNRPPHKVIDREPHIEPAMADKGGEK